jgi:hypothetical protein
MVRTEGGKCPTVHTPVVKGRKRSPNELLMPAPFSLEMLQEIFAKKIIGRRLNMPADAEIEKLARILNGWQAHYRAEQTAHPINEVKKKARKVMTSLLNLVATA